MTISKHVRPTAFWTISSLLLLLMLGAAPRTFAQAPAAPPADPQAAAPPANPDAGFLNFFRSTELGGLADAYYGYDSTKQPALFHAFDSAHDSFTLSMAELWLTKAPDKDSR